MIIGILIIKRREFHNQLIFIMEIHIYEKAVFILKWVQVFRSHGCDTSRSTQQPPMRKDFNQGLSYPGPRWVLRKKKFFKKAHIFKKKVKKRFSSLRIKPLKYADRLKGTSCDQG